MRLLAVHPGRFALALLTLLFLSGCVIQTFVTGPNQRFPDEPPREIGAPEKLFGWLYLPAVLVISWMFARVRNGGDAGPTGANDREHDLSREP